MRSHQVRLAAGPHRRTGTEQGASGSAKPLCGGALVVVAQAKPAAEEAAVSDWLASSGTPSWFVEISGKHPGSAGTEIGIQMACDARGTRSGFLMR